MDKAFQAMVMLSLGIISGSAIIIALCMLYIVMS